MELFVPSSSVVETPVQSFSSIRCAVRVVARPFDDDRRVKHVFKGATLRAIVRWNALAPDASLRPMATESRVTMCQPDFMGLIGITCGDPVVKTDLFIRNTLVAV